MEVGDSVVTKEFVTGGDCGTIKLNQILEFRGAFGLGAGSDRPFAREIETPIKRTNNAVGGSETKPLLPFCHPVSVDSLHTLGDRAFHGGGSSPTFYLEASKFPRVLHKS